MKVTSIETLIGLSKTGKVRLEQILDTIKKNGIENIDKDDLFFMVQCYVGKIITLDDYMHDYTYDVYIICDRYSIDIATNSNNSFLDLLGAFGELVKLYKEIK